MRTCYDCDNFTPVKGRMWVGECSNVAEPEYGAIGFVQLVYLETNCERFSAQNNKVVDNSTSTNKESVQ